MSISSDFLFKAGMLYIGSYHSWVSFVISAMLLLFIWTRGYELMPLCIKELTRIKKINAHQKNYCTYINLPNSVKQVFK